MLKLPDFAKTDNEEDKLPGPDHFDEVDVEGADDDGGPDGGHAQPVVHSRIAEIHHQVIIPLQQPHREARLEKASPSIHQISSTLAWQNLSNLSNFYHQNSNHFKYGYPPTTRNLIRYN